MATETNETTQERQERLKRLYYNKKHEKKITRPFEELYEWYEQQEKKCCYCGITEAEISQLFDAGHLIAKHPTRGRHLEIDRKKAERYYDDFDNLTLACYWCNNAKTDTFTYEEFMGIGKAIAQIWKTRLKEV
ncbi:hypothetical protein FACS189493_4710 [Spirochaetia bacterium]|nr:hypothetical protein FACS189493_4710 [Spirochaetia bacterium]